MIRKRGNGWQVDVQVNGKRYRKNFISRAEASAAEAAARLRIERGLPVENRESLPDGKPTLGALAELAANRYWKGTANETTARGNAADVVAILGKDRHPATITTTDVDRLVDVLEERGNSPATINRKLTALSRIMRFADERGLVDRMPAIERKRESQGRLRWYTLEEEARILKHLESTQRHDMYDLVVFLLDTGCRASEAARTEWRDVDLDTGFVRIWKTKNGKNRAVPLTHRVAAVLGRRAARRLPGCSSTDLVFPGWTDPKGRSNRMTHHWERVMRELKMDQESILHALRHTYASRLVQAEVPINVVQQLLGHSTPVMTLRYAHLAPTNLVSAVEALDRVTAGRIESAFQQGIS